MSWNSRFTRDPAEVGAALRAQREAEDNYARRRQQEMAGRDKSPTGVVRGKYAFDSARSAVGSLNRTVDAAIDEVAQAFERERQMTSTADETRHEDARRAPVLDNRRGVR